MKRSRRAFLRGALGAAAALALPLTSQPIAAACTEDAGAARDTCGETAAILERPAGDPSFEPFWVTTFLPTKLWPTATEVESPIETVQPDRLFRVDRPQRGYRLFVWDPRQNRRIYIGAEAVGPAEAPFWAAFADDGRWLDVNLTPLQNIRAMQGDALVMQDLVTAGLQGTTKPGFYRILRRVYNETMDSRTIQTTDSYYLKDVLYTQYFHGDGSAIHYNWWGPPRGFGYPGSHGCLGMRMAGSKFLWEWADIGTPLVIHY
ncbi:MAG: L,D-transpeptidase [Chloroflexota bacterium]|nr:L,D-transpeptidase [Chloroflexota bacterium]